MFSGSANVGVGGMKGLDAAYEEWKRDTAQTSPLLMVADDGALKAAFVAGFVRGINGALLEVRDSCLQSAALAKISVLSAVHGRN
jgi:hypothetical protein